MVGSQGVVVLVLWVLGTVGALWGYTRVQVILAEECLHKGEVSLDITIVKK